VTRSWITCAVACWVAVAACTAGRSSLDDRERAAVAAAVDSATRAFLAAQRDRDAGHAVAHLAPDFSMFNDGIRLSYDAVASSIHQTMGSFRHFESAWTDMSVRVLGRDAAVVSFTFRDSIVTTDDEILRFTGPTTLVWERRGSDWLIVYAHVDHAMPQ
jgi:ketosteroid isomerase-like protein